MRRLIAALLLLCGCDEPRSLVREVETPEADGALDAAPVDARPELDAGPGCVIDVDVLDVEETVIAEAACPVAGEGTCTQLAVCLCALLVAPEEQEDCLWAVAQPRAQENLSDRCAPGDLSMREIVEARYWRGTLPGKVGLTASAACAEVPATL